VIAMETGSADYN